MAKVLCVLYEDPVSGFPTFYSRDDLPLVNHYPGGQTLPSPTGVDYTPGELLGSVSGELGLKSFLESHGHTLVVTSDKDGPDSVFDRELVDAEVLHRTDNTPSDEPTSSPRSPKGQESPGINEKLRGGPWGIRRSTFDKGYRSGFSPTISRYP